MGQLGTGLVLWASADQQLGAAKAIPPLLGGLSDNQIQVGRDGSLQVSSANAKVTKIFKVGCID